MTHTSHTAMAIVVAEHLDADGPTRERAVIGVRMLAVLTTDELRAADALALEHFDESTLIGRAGTAVANAAVEMLGGSYGRRVAVICGKGNNGNDGKVAGARLARRGAKVEYFDPASTLPARHFDLLIDAAYGTGFRGHYDAPSAPEGTPVLAVDIPRA